MEPRLNLTEGELAEVALLFRERAREGLRRDGTEIKAIPAFVRQTAPPDGACALTLDLGGSNLRAALLAFRDGKPRLERGPLTRAMPWKRNEPFPGEVYLDIQADLLEALGAEGRVPLGYCFSYPARSTADGDAELIRWTKGISVAGTRGCKVGKMLVDRLAFRRSSVTISSVRVVNDTVATLFAGLPGKTADGYIGLVVGTGNNMAAFIDGDRMPKLGEVQVWPGPLPVNLESGNFQPPFLTGWDDEVDASSENPDEQRLEKAVSGLYLGRIFKAVLPGTDFDETSGGEGLLHFMDRHAGRDQEAVTVARQVYERSARFTAAALTGLAALLNDHRPMRTLKVVAEGGLFWSKPLEGPPYAKVVEAALSPLMRRLGMGDLEVDFTTVPNATLRGSALAALG